MDKEKLAILLGRGMTIRQVANSIGKSYSTARYWIVKHGLETSRSSKANTVQALEEAGNAQHRVCGTCLAEKPKSCFYRKTGGKLFRRCKKCQNLATRGAYQARIGYHRNRSRNNKRQRRSLFRDKLVELKNNPCTDCGQVFHWAAMDFDHVRGRKKFNISQAQDIPWHKIEQELKKCELVCANCHRIRSHGRLNVL